MSFRRFVFREARQVEARQAALQAHRIAFTSPELAEIMSKYSNSRARVNEGDIEFYKLEAEYDKKVASVRLSEGDPVVAIQRMLQYERRHRRNSLLVKVAASMTLTAATVLGPVRFGANALGDAYAEMVDGGPCRDDAERKAMPKQAADQLQTDAFVAQGYGYKLDDMGVLTMQEQQAVGRAMHGVADLVNDHFDRCELADGTAGDSDSNGRSIDRSLLSSLDDLGAWSAVVDDRIANRNEAARRLAEGGIDPLVIFPDLANGDQAS